MSVTRTPTTVTRMPCVATLKAATTVSVIQDTEERMDLFAVGYTCIINNAVNTENCSLFPTATGCTDGDVRLVNSNNANLTVITATSQHNVTEICHIAVDNRTFPECRGPSAEIIEGRVEVCQTNAFHTVCDDRWDLFEARVVCSQLNSAMNGEGSPVIPFTIPTHVVSHYSTQSRCYLSFPL